MSIDSVKDEKIVDTIRELCKELQKKSFDLKKIDQLSNILSRIGIDNDLYNMYEAEYDKAIDQLVNKGRKYMALWF
ncbi:MAG: hypothetical protein EAX96_08585 [Candidatus Lokiarchaeota archaeon]|nr:hypothetical protein [Candidatus Lokiarchaeota archaeon]